MKKALLIATIGVLALSGCGGAGSSGALANGQSVIVFEMTASNPIEITLTREGRDLTNETNPCSTTATSWCSWTSTSLQREVSFELNRGLTPYTIFLENKTGTDASTVIKIYIDGVLRFTKAKTVPANSTLNAAEIS